MESNFSKSRNKDDKTEKFHGQEISKNEKLLISWINNP